MISVEDRGDELYVVDAEKNEITIGLTDWEPGGSPREIDRRVDKMMAGKVSELRFPEASVSIESESDEQWTLFDNDTGPLDLGCGDHLIQIEANVSAFILFFGSATIYRISRGDDVIVSFHRKSDITLGFRSKTQLPQNKIMVPPTLEGIVSYISNSSSVIETSKPEKSYPSLRRHPPLIEFGENQNVPEEIQENNRDIGIRLRIPKNLASVFVASPLTYYLQASLEFCEGKSPALLAPSIGFEHPLRKLPGLQQDISDLLRRIFYLDCLVRNVGPYGADISECSLMDDINLKPSNFYQMPAKKRVAGYLETSFNEIESELPAWHLTMSVNPEFSYASALPYLLDRLCLIFLPKGSKLCPNELIKYSLGANYRSATSTRWAGSSLQVEPLKTPTRGSQAAGWMADGVPIDAFKALPIAFENRLDFAKTDEGTKNFVVILNESDMDEEQNAVQKIYRERSSKISINIEILEDLTREELLDVFARSSDFVHYIGHCEDDGFLCSNGCVSVSELEESNVKTFFLNACHSYNEGVELIKKGSVAGVVTLQRILDRQATRVGTAFSRLISRGFSIERALHFARSQAVLSKAYVAVGDGTYTLSQSDKKFPSTLRAEKISNNDFNITFQHCSNGDAGAIYEPCVNDGEKYLSGTEAEIQLSKQEFKELLTKGVNPVIYENELYWTDELIDVL